MEKLNVKEYDLDWIMENYFNTDKEVMFLCNYKTAWEILKYGEYEDEDFENFTIKLDNREAYYYIYKNNYINFIMQPLTIDHILYTIYKVDSVLIQDCVWDIYKDIIDGCNATNEKIILKTNNDDSENLSSLEETCINEDQEYQCDCCKCCDECYEDEKDEVLDQIYQQGVADTLKAIGELFNIEVEMN